MGGRYPYTVRLPHLGDTIALDISTASTSIYNVPLHDATYTGGRYGHYTFSHLQVFLDHSGVQFRFRAYLSGRSGEPLRHRAELSSAGRAGAYATRPSDRSSSWLITALDNGSYPVRIQVENTQGGLDVQEYILEIHANTPPEIFMAETQRHCPSSGLFELRAVVTDDGLPTLGEVHTSWRQLAGPAPVVIPDPSAPIQQVALSAAGLYLFELSASTAKPAPSGCLRSSLRLKHRSLPRMGWHTGGPLTTARLTGQRSGLGGRRRGCVCGRSSWQCVRVHVHLSAPPSGDRSTQSLWPGVGDSVVLGLSGTVC